MSKIFIECKYVGGYADHLYLVFQDNGGSEFVIRGGPQNDNPLNFGSIVTEVSVPIALSEDTRGTETPQDRGQRELDLGGRTAENAWDIMKQQATAIGAANLPYSALIGAQNSNSTVASVLQAVGINPFYNLPIGTGTLDFPGVDNFLNVSTTFHGTSSGDIIYGHTNSDNLNGGEGSDTYGFSKTDGKDVITDSDGQGQVVIDGKQISGAAKYVNAMTWTLDGYTLTKVGAT
jgi:hypothetical protein